MSDKPAVLEYAVAPPANPPWDGILPPRRPVTRGRLAKWAFLWFVAGLVTLLLAHYEVSWLRVLRQHKSLADSPIWTALRWLAEPAVLTMLALGATLLKRRRWFVIAHLLLAAYIAFNLTHLGKVLVCRERPLRFQSLSDVSWTKSWRYVALDLKRRSSFSSFPSGHSAAVFAVAGILVWFFPQARVWIILLAIGSSASRVMQNYHWPSDCWAGAWLGWLSAWMSLRVRGLTTTLGRGVYRLRPNRAPRF